ncbi:carbonic anhydrase [Bordetella bronchiseptica]|uniref:carbonic anhydrase n=1 Tax=Bordetella bronchiseptica TaxID=518 RepID=UPI003EDB7297
MSNKTTPTCNCLQHLLPLDSQEKPVRLSRRKLLSAGLMAGMAGGLGIVSPSPAHAQTTLTPEQALEKLRQGNERFARRAITSFQEDLDILQRRTADKQEPFAAVLACADSRMPVELVFDQSIGKLFVARVAGNIATPAIIASLEYGAAILGIKALVVLGHVDCGAIKAAAANAGAPGQISALYPYIRPAINASSSTDITEMARQNAINQARLLRSASPVLAKLSDDGALRILPALYDVADGRVSWL